MAKKSFQMHGNIEFIIYVFSGYTEYTEFIVYGFSGCKFPIIIRQTIA